MQTVQPNVRLLIVEDSGFIADSLVHLAQLVPNLTIVGRVTSYAEVVSQMAHYPPTIVSLDLRICAMPGGSPHADHGLAALHHLVGTPCAPPVLICTSLSEQLWLRICARAGAAGFVGKEGSSAEIIAAMNAIIAGMVAFTPAQLRLLHDNHTNPSPREYQVLMLLAEGLSNNDIAARMQVSAGTVRKHVENLCNTLGVHTRGQAVAIARQKGLIQ